MNHSEEAAYLVCVEDKTNPTVFGMFWARLGTIGTLMSLYREQRPNIQFTDYATCTHCEYVELLQAFDTLRLGGIWYRRGNAIDQFLHAISTADDEYALAA